MIKTYSMEASAIAEGMATRGRVCTNQFTDITLTKWPASDVEGDGNIRIIQQPGGPSMEVILCAESPDSALTRVAETYGISPTLLLTFRDRFAEGEKLEVSSDLLRFGISEPMQRIEDARRQLLEFEETLRATALDWQQHRGATDDEIDLAVHLVFDSGESLAG